jgi:cation:H+ antiporter
MDLLTLVLFLLGFVFLIWGAEILVRGASSLARKIGISPLIVGLTIVSFGTSAPELAINVKASFAGQPDIAIGNVIGSNISNVLLVLGLSATIAPLIVSPQLVRSDLPIMIGISFATWVVCRDGSITRLDGIILFLGLIVYLVLLFFRSRKQQRGEIEDAPPITVAEDEIEEHHPLQDIAMVAVGGVMLAFGSDWLINGAVTIAEIFGVPELIIGLTIVAVGTSLPEVATSAIASFRGERDIAVGNVVGSNIFNILSVLGITSIVAPNGIDVSTFAITFDIPIMILIAIACYPVFYTGNRVSRWQGILFLFFYIGYTGYLILRGIESQWLSSYSTTMSILAAISFAILLFGMTRQMMQKIEG